LVTFGQIDSLIESNADLKAAIEKHAKLTNELESFEDEVLEMIRHLGLNI
jgi:sporulation-control protein spo0M